VPNPSIVEPAASGAGTVTGAIAALLERHDVSIADGFAVVTSATLLSRPFDPGMGLLIIPAEVDATAAEGREAPRGTNPDHPAVLPGRAATPPAEPAALLRRLYPNDHRAIRLTDDATVLLSQLTDGDLATSAHYLPAVVPIRNAASLSGLPWLVARLRGPGGCPWDAEQDHLTLRPFLLEEAYEVYDALEQGSTPDLAEELGDLLLQIVLHAQYGAEAGVFDLADVERTVFEKIVRRHPHVFGDTVANTADEVIRNWEQIKAGERAAGGGKRAASADMPAAFAGLSKSLPALAYASEMQSRAASLGYDWPDLEGVIDKIAEEASELLAATEPAHVTEEYGDLLFVVVNLGRKMGVDPEGALRSASRKFASRFAKVERYAGERGLELRAMGLDALDELWQEAKREEAAQQPLPVLEGAR
jgi:tetrapyrrole methylase family protein/MazG family protein